MDEEFRQKLNYACRQCYRGGCSAVEAVVDAAIAAARAEEREAAAKVCDEFATEEIGRWFGPAEYRQGAKDCAAEIRALKSRRTP